MKNLDTQPEIDSPLMGSAEKQPQDSYNTVLGQTERIPRNVVTDGKEIVQDLRSNIHGKGEEHKELNLDGQIFQNSNLAPVIHKTIDGESLKDPNKPQTDQLASANQPDAAVGKVAPQEYVIHHITETIERADADFETLYQSIASDAYSQLLNKDENRIRGTILVDSLSVGTLYIGKRETITGSNPTAGFPIAGGQSLDVRSRKDYWGYASGGLVIVHMIVTMSEPSELVLGQLKNDPSGSKKKVS